ncbi:MULTISPECIES: DUF302 domain-containing protein [Rhodobacterales]|jgi:uncharacterized protein (DUF302 family)|uniref:DUF302 domain-containing protein n=1 Tax=Thalassobius vesicularis TaxID=1294297 RepID=A0A4S3M843_9RHOB|nr:MULTISPECIES: DUF302 domain-containing protein [Rhodobacterales]MCE8522386.1 DUF302 domain-containing protein [Ruegeria pomeroyi]OZB20175.1 MAG: hypothetical protein B7X55_01245 [Rhodobacterales bacterium 34-62-10]MCE8008295.1 DUF302 domain-containing protein [Aestuariivita sp.]MCE8529844.1 DUF302 domain-containing protein [Ruegeria pomeroyi]QYX58035.1 DUF302 domain-containing protein [Roseovarius sp. SCSIO 43702]
MAYTHDRLLANTGIDDAETRVRAALADAGFGVLTEIDVKATMKKKIDKDMAGYKILGACNPNMAWQAIGLEPRIGAMLPCNVILRSVEGGTEVSAIDPVASMSAVENPDLHAVAGQVRDMLVRAVDAA